MRKRKRPNKDTEVKKRLRSRLCDLLAGAYGGYLSGDLAAIISPTEDDNPDVVTLGLDVFARWVGSIKNVLLDESQAFVVGHTSLNEYQTVDSATEYLWKAGVRP